MDKINRNIYTGVSAKAALEILSEKQRLAPTFAIKVPNSAKLLNELYKALANVRNQRFLFVLPEDDLSPEVIDGLVRFFFLTNYFFDQHSPLILHYSYSSDKNIAALRHNSNWQGFENPKMLHIENYSNNDFEKGDFWYISSTQQPMFFSLFLNKIAKLEWLSQQLVFEVSSKNEAAYFTQALYEINKKLKNEFPGVYLMMENITRLETELRKSDAIIKFQEIEINNQKLYNSLIRGSTSPVLDQIKTDANRSSADTSILKSEYSKLCQELGKLRNEIAWYKRTYEERSLFGTIKEKILRSRKQKL